MSRAGSMEGLEELQQGLGMEFGTLTIGRIKNGFSRSPRAWQGSAGMDFTWKITPQPRLSAVTTIREIVEQGDAVGLCPDADFTSFLEGDVIPLNRLLAVKHHGKVIALEIHP